MSFWQVVAAQLADAICVQLEDERVGVSALLDGFKSRVLKGAAVDWQMRHVYATAWWRQSELDVKVSVQQMELLLLGEASGTSLMQLQAGIGVGALQGQRSPRWDAVAVAMTRCEVVTKLAAIEAVLTLLSMVAAGGDGWSAVWVLTSGGQPLVGVLGAVARPERASAWGLARSARQEARAACIGCIEVREQQDRKSVV